MKSEVTTIKKGKIFNNGLNIYSLFFFFFLTEPHTYLYNMLCKSLDTFLKKCNFLEKFILSFFFWTRYHVRWQECLIWFWGSIYINNLSDLIWTTEIFMTNQITSYLKTKLKIFRTKLVLRQLVSFREYLLNIFIKN